MSINIDCVDCYRVDRNDLAVRIFQQRLPDALRVSSIGHMVDLIEGRLGAAGKMRRLRIFGHGIPGAQGLGNSYHLFTTDLYNQITLRPGNEVGYADVLGRLTPRFDRGGWVELQGCSVGGGPQGWNLLKALAELWQVNVAAATVCQTPDAGFEVQYRVAERGGRVHTRRGNPYRPPVTGGGTQRPDARTLGLVLTLLSPGVGIGFSLGVLAGSHAD